MSRIKWKGASLVAPVPPTMITCSYEGKDNVFTVAWTGILATQPPKTYISVRPERYSHDMIKNSGEFVINLTSGAMVRAADWCGTYSGEKIDKFANCGLIKQSSTEVAAPTIAQSPLALECKVTDVVPMGSHDMFIADIVGVTVDEKLINDEGKLCMSKANLAAYAHGEYFELGKRIGTFGFSVRKKRKYEPKKTLHKKKKKPTETKQS